MLFLLSYFRYKEDLLRINMTGQKIEGEVDDRYYKSRLRYEVKGCMNI